MTPNSVGNRYEVVEESDHHYDGFGEVKPSLMFKA